MNKKKYVVLFVFLLLIAFVSGCFEKDEPVYSGEITGVYFCFHQDDTSIYNSNISKDVAFGFLTDDEQYISNASGVVFDFVVSFEVYKKVIDDWNISFVRVYVSLDELGVFDVLADNHVVSFNDDSLWLNCVVDNGGLGFVYNDWQNLTYTAKPYLYG